MWTDGDPDTEPASLVIRFMQAVAVAVCFPIVYGWMAEITQGLIDDLMAAIGAATDYDWQAWVKGISSLGLTTAIFGLIFVVCYFILYFQFLMRGLEIMILRIGMPMACVGLLDSDKGTKGLLLFSSKNAIVNILDVNSRKILYNIFIFS